MTWYVLLFSSVSIGLKYRTNYIFYFVYLEPRMKTFSTMHLTFAFCVDRKQCMGEPWEDFRWSSEEEQQQTIPVQAAASCWEGAGFVGTISFSKPRQLQPSHGAGSGNEGSTGVPSPLVQPGRRPAWWQPQSRREHQRRHSQETPSRRAAMVVCVCGLDTCDCNQLCVRILHHVIWADIRERPLYKLADLHGGLLLWESLYHSTSEGDWALQFMDKIFRRDMKTLIIMRSSGIKIWKSFITGSWFCCFLCSCSEESWPGGVWRASDRWEPEEHKYVFSSFLL